MLHMVALMSVKNLQSHQYTCLSPNCKVIDEDKQTDVHREINER